MPRRNMRRKALVAEINIVPYVDVMLVLLVIFMITAPLLTQGVNVELPKAEAKTLSTKKQEPIVVTVDRRGRYYLNTAAEPLKPVASERLLLKVAALLKLMPGRAVVVRGDKAVSYGEVVDAMVLLQRAGVARVGLVTETAHAVG